MVNLFPCAYSLMNMHFLLPAKSNYLFAIICTDVAKLEFSWLSAKTWGPEEYVLCQFFLLASGLMSPLKRELFAPGVGFYNRHFQNSKIQVEEVRGTSDNYFLGRITQVLYLLYSGFRWNFLLGLYLKMLISTISDYNESLCSWQVYSNSHQWFWHSFGPFAEYPALKFPCLSVPPALCCHCAVRADVCPHLLALCLLITFPQSCHSHTAKGMTVTENLQLLAIFKIKCTLNIKLQHEMSVKHY